VKFYKWDFRREVLMKGVVEMKMRILALWLAFAVSLRAEDAPKNMILMIGDGMGVSQVTAAKIVKGSLNMERLTTGGLMTTFSANSLVTDSAAGGTALATGYKTNNGMLSMTPDGKPLKTVAEYAKELGRSVGLVVTCSLTHATPAAFAAHVPSRKMDESIAGQIAHSGFDVLFGGGRAWFVPAPTKALPEKREKTPTGYGKNESSVGQRTDGRNLLEELRKKMPVAETPDEFRKLDQTDSAAALLYSLHPPAVSERSVSLAELTEKALQILSRDPDGFFLMIEGSQIDWAGHRNDKDWLADEMVDFDDAIGTVMNFAEQHPGTLVVVTADHETGGFAIHNGSLEQKRVDIAGFTRDGHTAAMVPVFAYGPGSEAFGGIVDITDVGQALIRFVSAKKKSKP
jgi:alkaline phosphatase